MQVTRWELSFKGFSSFEKLPEKLYIYTALFLSEGSRRWILENYPPKHANVFADHVTLYFKPSLEQADLVLDLLERGVGGGFFLLDAVAYAEDDKGQALAIEIDSELSAYGVLARNEIMHITISCADGVSPAYSNELLRDAHRVARRSMLGELGICSHADRSHLPREMWKRRGL